MVATFVLFFWVSQSIPHTPTCVASKSCKLSRLQVLKFVFVLENIPLTFSLKVIRLRFMFFDKPAPYLFSENLEII